MNPIQQAIEQATAARDWLPTICGELSGLDVPEDDANMRAALSGLERVEGCIDEALTSLRSLQKEVEGVELPDPKYIYHNSEMPGEDELFEFVDSGALDEDCPHCERLYTVDQLRTAVAAALGRGVVPQDDGGWLPFDYGNPPDDGLMFVAVSAPETDCDVDDYGRTVGWHTGEVEHSVCMVLFSAGDGGEHDFHPVAEWETGKVPADGVVTHYAPVRLPAIPKEVAAPSPEATQPEDELRALEREHLGDFDGRTGVYATQPDTMRQRLQQQCTEWKAYWRASDSHGVELTKPQAIELLQDALGVEVEIKDNGCETCDGTGMIGGPSFYAPDEGGVPCPDCTQPTQAEVVSDREALSVIAAFPITDEKNMDAVNMRDVARRAVVRAALATQQAGQGERDSEDVIQLLDEVRQHFTRDDDLPDNLLSRIDAAIRAARSSEGGGAPA